MSQVRSASPSPFEVTAVVVRADGTYRVTVSGRGGSVVHDRSRFVKGTFDYLTKKAGKTNLRTPVWPVQGVNEVKYTHKRPTAPTAALAEGSGGSGTRFSPATSILPQAPSPSSTTGAEVVKGQAVGGPGSFHESTDPRNGMLVVESASKKTGTIVHVKILLSEDRVRGLKDMNPSSDFCQMTTALGFQLGWTYRGRNYTLTGFVYSKGRYEEQLASRFAPMTVIHTGMGVTGAGAVVPKRGQSTAGDLIAAQRAPQIITLRISDGLNQRRDVRIMLQANRATLASDWGNGMQGVTGRQFTLYQDLGRVVLVWHDAAGTIHTLIGFTWNADIMIFQENSNSRLA